MEGGSPPSEKRLGQFYSLSLEGEAGFGEASGRSAWVDIQRKGAQKASDQSAFKWGSNN